MRETYETDSLPLFDKFNSPIQFRVKIQLVEKQFWSKNFYDHSLDRVTHEIYYLHYDTLKVSAVILS